MDLSLIYEIQAPDTADATVQRVFHELVEQVQLADELGFRTVWLIEHHFLRNFSLSSAPEVVIGHLAAKTKQIRLGHGIVQLPFKINHPARVAARIAVEDILSGGRMEFGGGRTTTYPEIVGFGLDPERTWAEWEEHLRILPELWTQDTVSWQSELFSLPERPVYPKPVQKPHPPMWVASQSPNSVRFAGENGLGVLGFGIGVEDSNDLVRLYKEKIRTCTPIGKFVNNRFAVLTMAMCCETDEEALRIQGPSFKEFLSATREIYRPWFAEGGVPDSYRWFVDYFERRTKRIETVSMEHVVANGGAVIGSPATCARVLQQLADYGVDEALLIHQLFNTPHDKIMRSLELLAREVKPRLKTPSVTL